MDQPVDPKSNPAYNQKTDQKKHTDYHYTAAFFLIRLPVLLSIWGLFLPIRRLFFLLHTALRTEKAVVVHHRPAVSAPLHMHEPPLLSLFQRCKSPFTPKGVSGRSPILLYYII